MGLVSFFRLYVVGIYAIKKLKGDDLIKVIEGFISIIINTNKYTK
jgi:hypothetical protein